MLLKVLPIASLLVHAGKVNAGFQDGYARVPPPTTTQAVLEERQFTDYPVACTEWSSALDFCKSVSPGFVSMDLSSQAPCLCYSSTSWIPSTFDAWAEQCANWAFTADFTDYSIVAGWEGLCTSAGNVFSQPATSSLTITSSPRITSAPLTVAASTNIFTNPGCSFLSFALSYCNSVSPGFTDLSPSSQAPCLCYSSTSWSPNGFDGPVSTCANFVKTADPSYYTDVSALEGFCSSIGDVTTKDGGASVTGTNGFGGQTGVGIALTNSQPSQTSTPSTATQVSTTTKGSAVVVVSQSSSKAGVLPTGIAFPGWVQVAVVVELAVAAML